MNSFDSKSNKNLFELNPIRSIDRSTFVEKLIDPNPNCLESFPKSIRISNNRSLVSLRNNRCQKMPPTPSNLFLCSHPILLNATATESNPNPHLLTIPFCIQNSSSSISSSSIPLSASLMPLARLNGDDSIESGQRCPDNKPLTSAAKRRIRRKRNQMRRFESILAATAAATAMSILGRHSPNYQNLHHYSLQSNDNQLQSESFRNSKNQSDNHSGLNSTIISNDDLNKSKQILASREKLNSNRRNILIKQANNHNLSIDNLNNNFNHSNHNPFYNCNASSFKIKSRLSVKETHQMAKMNQDRDQKIKEALKIPKNFVAGSSMDIIRKAKEQQANKDLIKNEENQSKAEENAVTEAIETKEISSSSSSSSSSDTSSSEESDSSSSSSGSSSSSDSSSSSSESSSSSDSDDSSSSDNSGAESSDSDSDDSIRRAEHRKLSRHHSSYDSKRKNVDDHRRHRSDRQKSRRSDRSRSREKNRKSHTDHELREKKQSHYDESLRREKNNRKREDSVENHEDSSPIKRNDRIRSVITESNHHRSNKSARSITPCDDMDRKRAKRSRSRSIRRDRKESRRSKHQRDDDRFSNHHSKRKSSHSESKKRSRTSSSSSSESSSSDSENSYSSSTMSGDDLRQKNRKIQRRSRTRSRSISRRKKSPSFKEKRRITSARKLPVPYKRNGSSSFSSPTLSTSILNENEFLQRSPPIKYRFSNNM